MTKESDTPKFVMCMRNDECEDLEVRKIYRVLADRKAEAEDYLRVVDESGEDYLYPKSYFVFVRLPRSAQDVVTESA